MASIVEFHPQCVEKNSYCTMWLYQHVWHPTPNQNPSLWPFLQTSLPTATFPFTPIFSSQHPNERSLYCFQSLTKFYQLLRCHTVEAPKANINHWPLRPWIKPLHIINFIIICVSFITPLIFVQVILVWQWYRANTPYLTPCDPLVLLNTFCFQLFKTIHHYSICFYFSHPRSLT